ncbi:MAG: leucine-rich repeat protein [Proteobacteria bacterium]|nr:leucine-rich repeat protein [Pseudomonadota bacterium]
MKAIKVITHITLLALYILPIFLLQACSPKCVTFDDKELERYALHEWDENHDGCLNQKEVGAVEVFTGTYISDNKHISACDKFDIESLNDLEQFPKLYEIMGLAGCKSLKEINLSNIRHVHAKAFMDCTNLHKLHLPNVQSVGDLAFYNCKALTRVNLPKAERIGAAAFSGCYFLEELILPSAWNLPNNMNDHKRRASYAQYALNCHGMPRNESCLKEIKETEYLYGHYYITDSTRLRKLVLTSPHKMGCSSINEPNAPPECGRLIFALENKLSEKVDLVINETQRPNVTIWRRNEGDIPVGWAGGNYKSIQFTNGIDNQL